MQRLLSGSACRARPGRPRLSAQAMLSSGPRGVKGCPLWLRVGRHRHRCRARTPPDLPKAAHGAARGQLAGPEAQTWPPCAYQRAPQAESPPPTDTTTSGHTTSRGTIRARASTHMAMAYASHRSSSGKRQMANWARGCGRGGHHIRKESERAVRPENGRCTPRE